MVLALSRWGQPRARHRPVLQQGGRGAGEGTALPAVPPQPDHLSPQHILVAKRQISVAKSGVEEFRQAFRSYTEVTAGQSSCLQ